MGAPPSSPQEAAEELERVKGEFAKACARYAFEIFFFQKSVRPGGSHETPPLQKSIMYHSDHPPFGPAAAARYKSKDLSRRAFAYLIKQLYKQTGEKQLPSEGDLEVAFELADEDKGGTVDEAEFLHLYEMVKQGHVRGLAGTNLSHTSPRQKENLENRREKFRRGLSQRRRTAEEVAAAEAEDHHHIAGEDTRRREGYHGREMIGEALAGARDEWAARQRAGGGNTTRAQDVGHLGHATAASQHAHDPKTLSRVEADLKWQKEERDHMSEAGAKAKEDFAKRMAKMKVGPPPGGVCWGEGGGASAGAGLFLNMLLLFAVAAPGLHKSTNVLKTMIMT